MITRKFVPSTSLAMRGMMEEFDVGPDAPHDHLARACVSDRLDGALVPCAQTFCSLPMEPIHDICRASNYWLP